jgi:hypothetical protein
MDAPEPPPGYLTVEQQDAEDVLAGLEDPFCQPRPDSPVGQGVFLPPGGRRGRGRPLNSGRSGGFTRIPQPLPAHVTRRQQVHVGLSLSSSLNLRRGTEVAAATRQQRSEIPSGGVPAGGSSSARAEGGDEKKTSQYFKKMEKQYKACGDRLAGDWHQWVTVRPSMPGAHSPNEFSAAPSRAS